MGGGVGLAGSIRQLRADLSGALVLGLTVGTVVLAAVLEPASWWELGCLVFAAVLLAVRIVWQLPAVVLTAGMLGAVGASQWSGALEPGLFLLSLLSLVLTGWQELTWRVVTLVLVVSASPLVIMTLQGGNTISGAIWVLGVLFPALFGAAFHRQEELAAQLEASRRELAAQAALEDRRQIARDVHDLVGHGLAGMMLQISSARHVLHRDVDAAEEALDSAASIGRQSLHELRRTVASLRDGCGSPTAPLPTLRDVAALVDSFRSAGLPVEHRLSGDHDEVDPVVGLTLHRIAQEALANAGHHAPEARTIVTSTVDGRGVLLEVETRGPARRPASGEADRPHYGLDGMRERAEMLGADFEAGPTDSGWLVRCRVRLSRSPGRSVSQVPRGKAATP